MPQEKRTNIWINSDIMAKAMKISGLNTQKDVVDLALREYVDTHSRMNLADLRGKIKFSPNCDQKALR